LSAPIGIYNGCVHVIVVVLVLVLFAIAFIALLVAARSIDVATGTKASLPEPKSTARKSGS
jgi:hypothetical protein